MIAGQAVGAFAQGLLGLGVPFVAASGNNADPILKIAASPPQVCQSLM